ncbi:unnamed protein product [Rhodiola kirilowii]
MTSFRNCLIFMDFDTKICSRIESKQRRKRLRSKIRRVRCAMEEIRAAPRREGGQNEHIRVDQTDLSIRLKSYFVTFEAYTRAGIVHSNNTQQSLRSSY